MSPESQPLETASPPYVDCIQWVPRRFAGGQSPVTIADLVFTQASLKAVRDAVETRPQTSVFGLFLGEIREDPTCERSWVRVNRVVHGPAISGDPSALSLAEVMAGLVEGMDDDRPVVGWYRSHPGAGLYLSPEEAKFHETQFSQPWAFSVIMVGDAGRLTGSVFQRTDPEGLSRSVYTPFYELVDDSSEFNGTTKRTYIGWPNYQTESQVVQAGQGSVSAQIPDGSRALVDVAAPKPAAVPEAQPSPAVAGPPVETPQPTTETPSIPLAAELPVIKEPTDLAPLDVAAEAPASEEPVEDVEVEWEKKQIQRSLTAVGRSIGSSALGGLSTPVQVDLEPASNQPEASDEEGESEPVEAEAVTPTPTEEPRTVIPIRAISVAEEPGRGLLGRARRHSGLPLAKVGSAAAAVALLMTAGWFGNRMLRSQPVMEDGGGSSNGSAVAGLSLAPSNLFNDEAPAERDDPAGEIDETMIDDLPAVPDAGEGESPDPEQAVDSFEGIGPMTVFDSADAALADGPEDSSARDAVSEPQTRRTDPIERPAEPLIVEAPDLESIEIDDPEVSAFKNALQIFRQEIANYESARDAFDAGDDTCNPLNLAARGVRDSFDRLDARFQEAAERFAGPELQAHEGAKRQRAMIDTHYSLTDCPSLPR